jgi:hypothetical protein
VTEARLDKTPLRVEEVRLRESCVTEMASNAAASARPQARNWLMAAGILLTVLAAYVLTNPGRIDIIDGQVRYDVARNWLTQGRPIVQDQWIAPVMGVSGRNGETYSFYGAPASVLSMPWVWLGLRFSAHPIEASQFLFSLTTSIVGAFVAPVLFLFYRELGVSGRSAFVWTMVSSFATLLWPASCTTFDNGEHALFGICAAYLGFLGSRRKSKVIALAGGVMAGVLYLYQEYFLLVIPALAITTLDWRSMSEARPATCSGARANSLALTFRIGTMVGNFATVLRAAFRGPSEARSSFLRYLWFLAGAGIGVLVSFAYNDLRFGSFFEDGKLRNFSHRHPVWGNPISGLPTLLVSPGKSILLYSPPLLLGIFGIRFLWRRNPQVAIGIVGSSVILVSFMSCYAGVGGDWCWGPRYLAILLPLWALAFPFISPQRIRRNLVVGIVAAGALVQLLALSVETQRFFFAGGLSDYFWAEDQWAYFKHSALLARVGETVSLVNGPPASALLFNSVPWCTYTILAPPPQVPRSMAAAWMQNFKIYYLPRPWPLWMLWVPTGSRPVDLASWFWALVAIGLSGICLVYRGLALEDRPNPGPEKIRSVEVVSTS